MRSAGTSGVGLRGDVVALAQDRCRGPKRVGGRGRRGGVAAWASNRKKNPGQDTDLYDLLGVQSTSTLKEIKSAYRKKAKTNHPDVGGDPEKFKAIAKAYAVLSHPEARSEYDRQRRFSSNGFGGVGGSGDYNSTFDFFASRAEEREEFYGLGDLFRDIEEEFSGVDAVFEKLGGDLLDFLESRLGETGEGEANATTTNTSTNTNTPGNENRNKDKDKDKDKKKNKSSSFQQQRGSTTTSKASFDAELELQELKRQMKKL